MKSKGFTIDNYIQVPGFAIVELKLSGNELLCYSLIYGFTQDKETEFVGSLTYVSSALNVTKQNAKCIIDRLLAKGLVEKREVYISGVKFCHYVANRNSVIETITPLLKQQRPVIETITPHRDSIYNNSDIFMDNNSDNNIPADGGLFPDSPLIEKRKGTSEPLCLFANSRFAEIDAFRAQFQKPEFSIVDIDYYYHAVADWSAGKGKKMRDWIATARNFIRRDAEAGKLHTKNAENFGGGGLSPEALKYLKDMA